MNASESCLAHPQVDGPQSISSYKVSPRRMIISTTTNTHKTHINGANKSKAGADRRITGRSSRSRSAASAIGAHTPLRRRRHQAPSFTIRPQENRRCRYSFQSQHALTFLLTIYRMLSTPVLSYSASNMTPRPSKSNHDGKASQPSYPRNASSSSDSTADWSSSTS